MNAPQKPPVDAYAHHLSQVNKKNQVLATEDIRNDNGVLLIKKGSPISEKLADTVVKHKLTRPLEHQVNLSDTLDAGRLNKAFSLLFQRYPDCEQVHQSQTLQLLLRELCSVYDGYSLLKQKLTVLSMQRPHDFQKGLFCAWFSMALARKMELPKAQIEEAFLAGLMHDTGMLHISREILDKKGQLTPEEWRTIQSHPVIGEVFLKQVPGLSPVVARATLEHHERRDGTGYPAGRFAEKLGTVGQIVAIADTVCAIRMLRLKHEGATLANLLPIIQFNGRSYDPDCYRALFSLIRGAGLSPGATLTRASLNQEIDLLVQSQQHLENCFKPISVVLNLLPEDSQQSKVRSAILQVQGCWFAVASSGLLAPALGQWLEQVKTETDNNNFSAVEEIKMMLKELHWQLLQVRKSLAILKGSEMFQAADAQKAMQGSLQVLEGLDQVFRA